MKNAGWEHFEHKGDIGIRGWGATPEEAFEQAAVALTAVITSPQLVEPRETVAVNCSADDLELLFVDFLNAILYEMAVRKMLFSKFEVSVQGNSLNALCYGERIDIARHQPATEVKGASFAELRVAKENSHWVAQCVVDV